MTTHSSLHAQASVPVRNSPSNTWDKLWTRLIEPQPTVAGDDRRKAVMLAGLTLVLMPLAIVTIFITPVTNALKGEPFAPPTVPVLIAVALIVLAYTLSRTTFHQIGAYIVIATPFFAVAGSALSSANALTDATLLFLALGVILSSLLLDARGTLVAGIVAMILAAYLQIAKPPEAGFSWIIISFLAVSTGVMALVTRTRYQYVQALERAQAQLQQRIIEVDQAREQAERSDQVKSAFLASMSHELRTPLNAIINFTKFVARGDLGPINTEQGETLSEVVDSAKHLLNLINDVLDMSKIESGSLNLFVTDDIDLNGIFKQVLSTGNSLLEGKPVEIRTDIADNLPTIRGDRQRIVQILLNIMSNACKFTEEGSINLSAVCKSDQVMITVSDTGPGIALEDQAAVFEAFKQTTSGLRQGGGTGLGMPITRSLVEAHGGHIKLDSQPGKGATFTVTLPVKADVLVPTLG